MQAAIQSTSTKAQRSWKHRIGLPAMVLVTAVASAVFSLLTMGVHPSPVPGHAPSVDILSQQLEVKERDEAAFAASWAADRAAEQARMSSPKAIQTVVGVGCGEDCLTSTWPDGPAVTSDLTSLMDFAAICACPIVIQPR